MATIEKNINDFPYIVDKAEQKKNENDSSINGQSRASMMAHGCNVSFHLIISLLLVVILFYIFFSSVNKYYIQIVGISSHIDNPNKLDYDLNYLVEQSFYTTLDDISKKAYLELPDEDKLLSIRSYFISKI